jgi:hypothetical protein
MVSLSEPFPRRVDLPARFDGAAHHVETTFRISRLILWVAHRLFLFAVIFSAVLLFTSVFFIIMFSDLECVRLISSPKSVGDTMLMHIDNLQDYLNPIDLCNKLNQVCSSVRTRAVSATQVPDVYFYPFPNICATHSQFVLPEMIAHAFLTTTFLFSFQFIALILNAPLVAYNVNKIMQKQHMYDATEIFRTLGAHKKECFIKLG